MKKILVPIDFSPLSHKALRYAINIAQKNEAALVLLNVSEDASEAGRQFTPFLEEAEGIEELTYERIVKTGDVVEAIHQVAGNIGATLIVMGTQGQHREEGDESITSKVIDKGACPVLAVPEKCSANRDIRKIAFATDYQHVKNPLVLGTLTAFARIFDAEVHVLNVKNEAQQWNTTDQEITESNLEYFLESIDHSYNFTDNPDLEEGIYNFIKANEIDLLAMMPRKHAGDRKPAKGRLTENIALRTEIPLLTFHEV